MRSIPRQSGAVHSPRDRYEPCGGIVTDHEIGSSTAHPSGCVPYRVRLTCRGTPVQLRTAVTSVVAPPVGTVEGSNANVEIRTAQLLGVGTGAVAAGARANRPAMTARPAGSRRACSRV